MKKVIIYTDGACSGNPGKGGYGAILLYGEHKKEISGGFLCTTNNRMELLAPIKALELLKEKCEINIYSDSKYLVDAINKKWVFTWEKNNWIKSDKKKALNIDLWQQLLALIRIHNVTFIWVKGHNDNEGNERCDELARMAIENSDLETDEGFIPKGQ